jgi:hypothetical protein
VKTLGNFTLNENQQFAGVPVLFTAVVSSLRGFD